MAKGVLSKLRSPLSPKSTSRSSESLGDDAGAQLDRPVSLNVSDVQDAPKTGGTGSRRLPSRGFEKPDMPTENEQTPMEMIPVLSLLVAHSARIYKEGFLMVMPDLDNEGRPAADRQWNECYVLLSGTQLTMWNAESLDRNQTPKPVYHNIQDATMKSLSNLSTSNGSLENVIVLSTTMKNRLLLQIGSRKTFEEWTAALRLAIFERSALQEAYTGALLSSKGTKMHGIRALLGETKFKREEWISVRFGAGMPWKTVYGVLLPASQLKHKHERKAGYGRLEFYEDRVAFKKGREPLATVLSANAAYAVFPERSVLMELSTLIQIDGDIRFRGEQDVRESGIFIMPEQHRGIQGFETLIRTLIPLFDVFGLYGRPKRLNADKNDINSLLFAMPTLPKAYYCDVSDIYLLTSISGSERWNKAEWMHNIKEMLARKMATGFRGVGNIHAVANGGNASRTSSSRNSSKTNSLLAPPVFTGQERSARAVSDPSRLQGPLRSAPRAPVASSAGNPNSPSPKIHQRSASQGHNDNALIVPEGPGLLTPNLEENEDSELRRESYSSFKSAPGESQSDLEESQEPKESSSSRLVSSENLFDPGYKPRHISYGEYSDYVRHYTNPQNQVDEYQKIDDSPTQVSAPRIGPYPRAPGSPRNISGGLLDPQRDAQQGQRRPSGPRPQPDDSQMSLNSSVYSEVSHNDSQSRLASNIPRANLSTPPPQNQKGILDPLNEPSSKQGRPIGPRPVPGDTGPSARVPPSSAGTESQLKPDRVRPEHRDRQYATTGGRVPSGPQGPYQGPPPQGPYQGPPPQGPYQGIPPRNPYHGTPPLGPYQGPPPASQDSVTPEIVQGQFETMNMYQHSPQMATQQQFYQSPYQIPYQMAYQPQQIQPQAHPVAYYGHSQGYSPYAQVPTGPVTGGPYTQPYRAPSGPQAPGNAKTGPYIPGTTKTPYTAPQPSQTKAGKQRTNIPRATGNVNSRDKGPYAL